MRYKNFKFFDPDARKVAVVTGGTGALGSSVVKALCARHWKVAFLYHANEQKAQSLVKALKRKKGAVIKSYQLDLSKDPGNIVKVISSIEKEFKSIDALIHCASAPFNKTTALLESAVSLNTMNAVHVSAFLDIIGACLPGMKYRQSGTIIGILSEAMLYRVPGWSAYVSSKAALASYLSDIASSSQTTGVRTVGILPGMFKAEGKKADGNAWPLEVQEARKRLWPAGIETDKIAGLIADVLDQQGRYANGSFWAINAHEGIRDVGAFGFQPKQLSHPSGPEVVKEIVVDKKQDNLRQQLVEIFKELFDLATAEEAQKAQLGILSQWDSLKHIDVLMTVEEKMKIQFSDSDISALISFESILETIRKLRAHV